MTSQPLDHYVGVEIAGVTTAGSDWRVVDDEDEAEFFSVSLKTPDGFSECIAYADNVERADAIAAGFAALMGWAERAPDERQRRSFGDLGDQS